MKVVCTKVFDSFYSEGKNSLETGKIYDFGYKFDAPVLYYEDGTFGRLANFQIEFFTQIGRAHV